MADERRPRYHRHALKFRALHEGTLDSETLARGGPYFMYCDICKCEPQHLVEKTPEDDAA